MMTTEKGQTRQVVQRGGIYTGQPVQQSTCMLYTGGFAYKWPLSHVSFIIIVTFHICMVGIYGS